MVDYETRYVHMEKPFLAKLRHYMLNHTTYVIEKVYPLKYMMNRTHHNTRITMWIMLFIESDF